LRRKGYGLTTYNPGKQPDATRRGRMHSGGDLPRQSAMEDA
jgi:hypothetical protein